MVDYQNTAQGLATLGRGGDSTLVHMNPSEVAGLQNLAVQNGTSLTINPNTGMPEAFSLSGLIPMAIGGGLTAASGGTISPLMAGLMVGGATAVMQGDIMAGLGAGLGAYGGGSLAEGFSAAAEAVPVGSTTGEVVQDQIQQNISNMNNPMSAGGNAGFNSAGGTMGIDGAIYNDATGITSKVGTTNPVRPFDSSGVINRDYTQVMGQKGVVTPPPTTAIANKDYTGFMGGTENAGNATYLDVAKPSSYNPALNTQAAPQVAPVPQVNAPQYGNPAAVKSLDPLTNLSIDSISDNLSQTGQGIKNVFTDYSATRDAMGLTDGEMAMKFGMPMAAGLAGGLEESDFQEKGVDMTEFEDNRFRGPDGQLNLSGKTALNLNNPYGYAKGGAVEQGMEAAIARNIGKTYTPPTPVSAPVSAPVAPSNINVGGFRSAPSNLTGGMGSLNVGTGTIGKSPNAVAAKAIEDAKPKTRTMQGMYGMQMTVPIDYDPGTKSVFGSRKPSHYQLKDGTWVKGTPPPSINLFNSDQTNAYGYVNKFAKGGAVEQGMEAAIARNMGRTYTPTAPVSAPVSAPVASSNINVGGFRRAPSNFGGLGALNVRTGTVGQSPNAVAEAARLKAIEDAKPKYTTPASGTNVGGGAPSGGNSGFSVPTKFVVGMGTVPADYTSGLLNPYYRDIAGNFIRKAQGGIIPAAYAEGGAVEQGMEAAIARNSGRGSSMAPAPIAGPADSISNFNNLGSLNVNSGTIGQSPNAVAAAARLKAIEDAKPKPKPVYQGFSVTQQQGPTLGDILGTTGPGPRNYAPTPYDIIFGGQQGFAEGGYLGGGDINVQGDGMSDDIPANIDNEQPAALSEGEFVIPADVVSHIGNGSSEAGAKEFYGMMDRVRMARTGRKKQSPEIDPERFMPA